MGGPASVNWQRAASRRRARSPPALHRKRFMSWLSRNDGRENDGGKNASCVSRNAAKRAPSHVAVAKVERSASSSPKSRQPSRRPSKPRCVSGVSTTSPNVHAPLVAARVEEGRVLARPVVRHPVEQHAHSALVRLVEQAVEVVERSQARLDREE